jgi:hypothetical protein
MIVLLASLLCLTELPAQNNSGPFHTRTATSQAAIQAVPMDAIPAAVRERVRKVMLQPTMVTHAGPEETVASLATSIWLLEHPDRTAVAWQRMGVRCTTIQDRGQGRFAWTDDQGSEVGWFTVYDAPGIRVWYAEGHVKAGALIPTIPVHAVVVLRYSCPQSNGPVKIHHEVDIFMSTDSRAANLAARVLGPSADHLAEQGAGQMLTFFGNMAQYLAQHPDQQEKLLAPPTTPATVQRKSR